MCRDRTAETEVAQAMRRVAHRLELEIGSTHNTGLVEAHELPLLLRMVAEELDPETKGPNDAAT